MIKNKNELIEIQSKLITERVTAYLNEIDQLSDTDEFTIDNIEKSWSQLDTDTKQIYSKANAELVRQASEKKLIRKKKNEYAARGIILKNDKKECRKILTVNGILPVWRTLLRPADAESAAKLRQEGRNFVAPLDEALAIDRLPYKITRKMMVEIAFWAQNQASFREASNAIMKTHGIPVSANTVRNVAGLVGSLVYREDTAGAEKVYNMRCRLQVSHMKKGILYIQADGAALNTRRKNEEGSSWRENKLGIVFSSDNILTTTNRRGEKENHIKKKEYTSYVGSVDRFKKYLFACAVRNGYGSYEKTVVLSDGATWIRNMCDEIFPDAIQILDLYHLCENTYEYAKAIFHDKESEYRPWAEKIISWLKCGKKDMVMEELKKYQRRRLKKGTVNLQTYIENNANKINYPDYKASGYYVGSGAIESGNKVVLQKRLKLAGMRWDENTAQYLLTLRAKYESGLWVQDVEKYIEQYSF